MYVYTECKATFWFVATWNEWKLHFSIPWSWSII